MQKENNTELYFYAVCLEYENGEYYYRYETSRFPYRELNGLFCIEKYPGCPFYLDSTYTPDALNMIHGTRNHWYAYVVCSHENEDFAKNLLIGELERRHRQALGIVNAAESMLSELEKSGKDDR